jgi:predicted nucleic acid-binding protein
MAEVVRPGAFTEHDSKHRERPLVFLDTNVIIGYLRGEASAVQLVSAESSGLIQLAINPIVLQELLFAEGVLGHGADVVGSAVNLPEFQRIRDHLQVLPVNAEKAEALLPRARNLRNRLVHSNDLLILSSADECDFLVTSDEVFKRLVTADRPQVVTPEELVIRLPAA